MTPPEMDEDDSAYVGGDNGLLAWIIGALVLAFVIFAAWTIVAIDTKDEQRIDAERRYEESRDYPVPTVTVETPGPVRTKIVTTPGPTRTIYVTERASRSAARSTVRKAKADSSVGDKATLACIRKHESGNNYRAVNSTGKFRGAYQFHRGYAPVWAERAGYGQWSGKTPDKWPPSVQDAVAYDMGHSNRYAAWRKHTSYDCPGF